MRGRGREADDRRESERGYKGKGKGRGMLFERR